MIVRLVLLGTVALLALTLLRRRAPQDPEREFANDRGDVEAGLASEVERRLREDLLAAETGFRTPERWALVRTRLAQLLIGAGELDAAEQVLARDDVSLDEHLDALGRVPVHEHAVLTGTPDGARLEAIQRDRDTCLRHLPAHLQHAATDAWGALEGLCRTRSGDDVGAIALLEAGLYTLENNLARVAYLLHLGRAQARTGRTHEASATLEAATHAFPRSRWAREAAEERDRLKHT